MYLSGYIFWSINDTRLSILMDNLNDFSGLINCNLKNYTEKTSQTKCFLFLIASNNYPNRVLKFKVCLELEKRK